mmetsp:Transcript_2477/g.4499  ORF Transcript_2477/g.4499 Transcript_2477/m.4499 type:complete len:199 (+) Transcript_2477:46-642(+)
MHQTKWAAQSPTRRGKKPKASGTSPHALLFVAVLFVCITMISFYYHESDDGRVSNTDKSGLTNPYLHKGKLLKPDTRAAASHNVDSALSSEEVIGTATSPAKNHNPAAMPPAHIQVPPALSSTPKIQVSTIHASDVKSNSKSKSARNAVWMNHLFEALQNQQMLTINAQSKVHLWDDVEVQQVPGSSRKKRVMFFMGE